MQLNLNNLGNNVERRLLVDSKSTGKSLASIIEDIIKTHYEMNIELSPVITYDMVNGTIYDSLRNETINLTNKENGILTVLVKNKNCLIESKLIYLEVWDSRLKLNSYDEFKFTFRNMILQLRRKLGKTVSILNKSGVGYMIHIN